MSKRPLKFLSTSNNTTTAIWTLYATCAIVCEKVAGEKFVEFPSVGMPVEIDSDDGWDKMNTPDIEQFIQLDGKLGSGQGFNFMFWMVEGPEGCVPGRVVLEIDSTVVEERVLRAAGNARFDEKIPGKIVVDINEFRILNE